MPSKTLQSSNSNDAAKAAAKVALHDVEPELRQLEGVLMVLTVLGEAQDSVEPIALAALARSGSEAFAEISKSWRTVFEAVAGS